MRNYNRLLAGFFLKTRHFSQHPESNFKEQRTESPREEQDAKKRELLLNFLPETTLLFL